MKSFPLLFLLLMLPLTAENAPSPAKPDATAAENPPLESHVYKKVGDRQIRLFVAKPANWKASDKRPAIVFFHGGGWVGGTPTQFDFQARELASRGMVAVLADYRNLKGTPSNTPPDVCIQDAKSAIRWLRRHAGELGVDVDRLAAGGGSAGGHLAAFAGMAEGLDDPADDSKISAKPNALVLFNPVFDNGPDDGWGTQRVGKDYTKYSPAHQISKDDPPTIVFLGKKDDLIPVKVVERFAKGMKDAGVRCDAHFYDGQAHGFFNKEPHKTETLTEAIKFLASLGWIPPKEQKTAP